MVDPEAPPPLSVGDITCPECGTVGEISETVKVVCRSILSVFVEGGEVVVQKGDDTEYTNGDHTTLAIRCDYCLGEFPSDTFRTIMAHLGEEEILDEPNQETSS